MKFKQEKKKTSKKYLYILNKLPFLFLNIMFEMMREEQGQAALWTTNSTTFINKHV